MDDTFAAGTFVQIIDILSDEQKPFAKHLFKPRQRQMRRVGLDYRIVQLSPPFIIKTQHQFRIASESFWRCDIFNAMIFP